MCISVYGWSRSVSFVGDILFFTVDAWIFRTLPVFPWFLISNFLMGTLLRKSSSWLCNRLLSEINMISYSPAIICLSRSFFCSGKCWEAPHPHFNKVWVFYIQQRSYRRSQIAMIFQVGWQICVFTISIAVQDEVFTSFSTMTRCYTRSNLIWVIWARTQGSGAKNCLVQSTIGKACISIATDSHRSCNEGVMPRISVPLPLNIFHRCSLSTGRGTTELRSTRRQT